MDSSDFQDFAVRERLLIPLFALFLEYSETWVPVYQSTCYPQVKEINDPNGSIKLSPK
jgi:hypothetical protein